MNARMKLTGLGLAATLTLLSGAVLRGPATPALGASVSAGVPAGAVITQTFSGVTGQTSETVAYNANGPSAGPPAIPAPATQTLAGTNLTAPSSASTRRQRPVQPVARRGRAR